MSTRTNCVICLEKSAKYRSHVVTCCGHAYHKRCLTNWYKSHNVCPTCRLIKKRIFQHNGYTLILDTDKLIWRGRGSHLIIRYTDIDHVNQIDNSLLIRLTTTWGNQIYKLHITKKTSITRICNSLHHLCH